ncbi:MAG TPA: hypothetical protein P5528_08360 [Steroidobacteraceae bacterium]|nr:hypothetical protein [Steroidobacteraceae bacterium]HRX89447.1 hypothetical protein [Steroidobacteraceae bacterium]
MEEVGLAYGLVKYLHLLLFVYWLGGDAGVYYSSGFVIDPKRSRDARLTAAKIFIELDMLPRYCLALMLTVGGVLAYYIDVPHLSWQLPLIIILGPLWVWMVWAVHHYQGKPLGAKLAKIDLYFRWFMIAAIIVSVSYALFVDGRLRPYPWLAAKLYLFATLILAGLLIRLTLPAFNAGFKTLATTGPTPESDQQMLDGMRAARVYVWYIWFGVAVSALIGVLKPGAGG